MWFCYIGLLISKRCWSSQLFKSIKVGCYLRNLLFILLYKKQYIYYTRICYWLCNNNNHLDLIMKLPCILLLYERTTGCVFSSINLFYQRWTICKYISIGENVKQFHQTKLLSLYPIEDCSSIFNSLFVWQGVASSPSFVPSINRFC